MSRGNFAYHFKFKEDVLAQIAEKMKGDIEHLDHQRKGYPAFSNLTLDIAIFGNLQTKYEFIFRDMNLLSHQPIKDLMSSWSERTIQRNMQSFSFAIKVGTMKKEPWPGLYFNLAVNTWLIMYYWVAQQHVREVTSAEKAEKMVWSTIIPHFTEKGIDLFSGFYGSEFLEDLGASFADYVDLKKVINQK